MEHGVDEHKRALTRLSAATRRWDYGYQTTAMANRTVIVDNNTWNNTHIATVGRAMASHEEQAWQIYRSLDVNYVFVVFGGFIGCGSGKRTEWSRVVPCCCCSGRRRKAESGVDIHVLQGLFVLWTVAHSAWQQASL